MLLHLDNLFLLMEKVKIYIIVLLLGALQSCKTEKIDQKVEAVPKLVLGNERLITGYFSLIKNKRLGIVVNKASTLSNGVQLLDTLRKLEGVNIKAVFSPEHGFDINYSAGETVSDSYEKGIPVYSLYGKNRKPSAKMLKNIDLLIYDLQDVGTRFYTYVSTLYYIIQTAGEYDIPVLILDRPDPIGGYKVEGPVLDTGLESFVGIARIPVVYGLTAGELAEFFAGEYPAGSGNTSVDVIKMKNWERNSYFDDYELKWIPPSPNIPDAETAVIYPATAVLEATNISEGRGTENPFKQIGAPFIDSGTLINQLDSFPHPGISLRPVSFTPVGIPGKAENPKYKNQKCSGIFLILQNADEFKPVDFSIRLLYVLHKLYPEKLKFNAEQFDRLTGNRSVREQLIMNKEPEEIIESWQTELNKFLATRTKYLLY